MGDKQNERGDFCGRPGPLCSIWDNEIAPARGNPVAGRGLSHCQPRAIALPAAGNRSASRGQSKCQPQVHRVPAAGTSSASRGESCSQPLGIVFPALGNRVPSPWESCSQPLGIQFPSAGVFLRVKKGTVERLGARLLPRHAPFTRIAPSASRTGSRPVGRRWRFSGSREHGSRESSRR